MNKLLNFLSSIFIHKWCRFILNLIYTLSIFLLTPLNYFLLLFYSNRSIPRSVLHISYMVHIPYHTTQILRDEGIKADYLAIGSNPNWDKCDYQFSPRIWQAPIRAFLEFILFWKVVAKYQVIHSHFMLNLTKSGWELPLLKKMNRKLIIHYRGCEIRDRKKNAQLHPKNNICQNCDYNASVCQGGPVLKRRQLSKQYGDAFLVTTPDMLDFSPQATHMPFFIPPVTPPTYKKTPWTSNRPLRIFHTTNHPGIEGTSEIKKTIDSLKEQGFAIEFIFLQGVSHQQVLEECSRADLSIGKMKMGYYANAQIESMYLGTPAITYIRPEFITEQIVNSSLIITSLDKLEETLKFYLTHPKELLKKQKKAAPSIALLHNNKTLVKKYLDLYQFSSQEALKQT